jgi:hypothetical protein
MKIYLRAAECVGSGWKQVLVPMAGFGINDIEPSGSTTAALI